MPKAAEKITPDDLPRLMETLAGEDADAQQHALKLLCPCRNRVYDREVWMNIYRALDSPLGEEVRDRAKHAVETLERRALVNDEAKELLDWLARHGFARNPHEGVPKGRPDGPRRERLLPGDLPRVVADLTGEDPDARQRALRVLCPCRNRVYDREIWREVFHAYEHGTGDNVRDQAQHAIETLLQRARIDPRSQELLRWLADQEVTSHPVAEAIPEWRPRPEGSLPIPRWERTRRSKANRRRR